MGGKKSKPEPPKDFKQPWRNIVWNQFRILLHGPVGAGKTCFINSVKSVFKGRIVVRADEETSAGKSFTKTYQTYKVTDKDSVTLPFVLNDVMGLEDHEEDGIHPNDIINALHGHLKDGYKFNPVSPLTDADPEYIHNPSLSDKVHCLVSVVPANSISRMNEDVIQKMKTVRQEALKLGIPHVVLMTKVDAICPLVKKDLAEIYKSRKIKEKMEECSHRLGPPLKCIFPVCNYHEEIETNDKKDVLILIALKAFTGFADDYFEEGNI
ncbi:hypothetical protein KOW79_020449 [Hemibagrus wyckioides]|uniref:Interferon-induced protein 44-like n=1 Tax=Hemibagrus wyckioides TaxID=337641 RepID=A0A9D3N698_9TELE|nr:hypothetical protein KOW79_020449 [Hemibagrus wyckioides]